MFVRRLQRLDALLQDMHSLISLDVAPLRAAAAAIWEKGDTQEKLVFARTESFSIFCVELAAKPTRHPLILYDLLIV
ncbi:MAG: hypothetical protein CM15mP125_0690 [Gammaproteobacteria bacterium]|nr:MAG: hypothetical protein CM15mP125_0690 [Gammaproteobacteria bacterium]